MSGRKLWGVVIVGVLISTALGCGGQSEPAPATPSAQAAPAGAMETAVREEPFSGEVMDGVRVVKVEAHRWEYVPNRIVVKRGEPVRLLLKSSDVTHGFGITGFKIKETLPPGTEVKVEFAPDKTGEFEFRCTVYCGEGHDRMQGKLIVRE